MRTNKVLFILLLTSYIGACRFPAIEKPVPTKFGTSSSTSTNDISITSTPLLIPEKPTPTFLPEILANNTKEILEKYVRENGGCRLPCIMGLTLGLSEKPEVNAFIQYFQQNAREAENLTDDINIWSYTESSQGGISLRFFEEEKSVSIGLSYIMSGSNINRILLGGESYQYLESGGAKKRFGDPYFTALLSGFSLPSILNFHGPPSQVLIWPHPNSPGRPSPPAQYTFSFVLVYTEKGFLVQYISERKERDNYFVGCPTEPYSLDISAWDPKVSLDLIDAVEYFSNVDGVNSQNTSVFKSLEDASTLNIREFYDMFKKTDATECIETPKELWP